jgi:hypothetical protein
LEYPYVIDPLLIESRNEMIFKIGVEIFKIRVLKKFISSDFIDFILSKKANATYESD